MTKIKLRLMKHKDIEQIRRWRMSDVVTKYLLIDPNISADDQEKWFRHIQSTSNTSVWIINYNNIQDIGYVVLNKIDRINKTADPGVFIGEKKYRGRGLGTAIIKKVNEFAFTKLGLNKLYGPVLSKNYAALAMYMKCGWKIEGCQRQQVFKHGIWYDIYWVGILKSEWEKQE